MREIHRILFVRTDRIGDVLLNLPALRLLRQTFPKAWIALCVDAPVANLLQGHPDLDEVLALDRSAFGSSASYRMGWARKVRAIGFDLVVVSNPDKWMHAIAFWARIPHRVGYDRKWGFFLTKKRADRKDAGARHEIDSNLDLVSLASEKTWDGTWALPVDAEAVRRVKDLLEKVEGDIIAMHPGTSNPDKRWPIERFVELEKMILEQSPCQIVVIGGEEEKALGVRLARGVGVLDLTGQLTLKDLTAFFKNERVKTLVSADSGPVHVAWISGKPVVALYAQNCPGSNPARWGPRDGKSQVIYKPISEITADEVFRKLQTLLAQRPCNVF